MKKILAAFLVILSCQLYSQGINNKSAFVLKGNIKHSATRFFECTVTGFFNNSLFPVAVDSAGSFYFNKTFEGKQQTMYCYLDNDVLTFTVRDGDSLVMSWDDTDFKNSFEVKSPQSFTNKVIRLQHQQYLNFHNSFIEVQRKLVGRRIDRENKEWLHSVHELFKKELTFLVANAADNEAVFTLLYTDLYFKYARALSGAPVKSMAGPKPEVDHIINGVHAENANMEQFLTSYNCRRFLLANLRLPGINFLDDTDAEPVIKPASKGLVGSVRSIPMIRDWYIVNYVRSRQNPFNQEKAGDIYKKAAAYLSDAAMLEKLDEHLSSFTRIKAGSEAPLFTLKDSLGQQQSLADFKGKVVYVDFWGVSCVPCIHDIINNGPALHGRYKNSEVVFISICVDADGAEWKAALKNYNMTGSINLIAEDGFNHPVVQQYSASSLPTYIIVGKDGRIFDNHAPQMGELMNERSNSIDRALMVYDEY